MSVSTSYKDSGVDLERSDRAKAEIKAHVKSTHTEHVLRDIGLFSGFFRFDAGNYANPVLVSSIDGVGTKVKVAKMMGVYDTIGADLVNHSVNDIMVCGADPLFFMDYIAADRLSTEMIGGVIEGMASACKAAKCALIGGETAEMPGVYTEHSFDLAGTIVGAVDRDRIIDGSNIVSGDVLVGVASNGIHTNGYSLVRKVFFENGHYAIDHQFDELDMPLGAELLKVHKSYFDLIRAVRDVEGLKGISHITGGGIVGNTARLLPSGCRVALDWKSWDWPAVFRILKKAGEISDAEMRNVFNLGVGLVLVVAKQNADRILEICASVQEQAFIIGSVVEER